jgi:hypothetical protein
MNEKKTDSRDEKDRPDHSDDERPEAEQVERPVPGIRYEREPDAENIMPVEDRPGTF